MKQKHTICETIECIEIKRICIQLNNSNQYFELDNDGLGSSSGLGHELLSDSGGGGKGRYVPFDFARPKEVLHGLKRNEFG